MLSYDESERLQGLNVLFSAHGVPRSYIDAGDPYQRQIEECVRLISIEIKDLLLNPKTRPAALSESQAESLVTGLRAVQYHLSFQSRVGPVQWLRYNTYMFAQYAFHYNKHISH